MPFGIPSTIQTELQQSSLSLFYLVNIQLQTQTLYYSERQITYNGNSYSPRLLNISGLSYSMETTQQISITLANVDGVISNLDKTNNFLGARVTILEYFPDQGLAYNRWTGFADNINQLDQMQAVLPIFSNSPTTRINAPRRIVSTTCPWDFANYLNYDPANPTTSYEGSECQYQHASYVGFTNNINQSGGIDGVTNPITFTVFALANGQIPIAGDQFYIDSEIIQVLSATATSYTALRAQNGTSIAAHTNGSVLKFANCDFTPTGCQRRGMYGNNSADLNPFTSLPQNYFGGQPFSSGTYAGNFPTTPANGG